MYGVRLMSLESDQKKRSTSSLDYARTAIKEEVDSQFSLDPIRKFSFVLSGTKAAVVSFFSQHCDDAYWQELLRSAGMENTSKKESEIFLNSYSSVLVTPIVMGIMNMCSKNSKALLHRRALNKAAMQSWEIAITAQEVLGKYFKGVTWVDFWDTFQEENSEVLTDLLRKIP